ncbi:sulfotransferase [Palleronia sp.]|uniref:sulfotransferase n=1 Tax=Palleronia sp. TaxID=1940284 RepID=UPI0035C7E873
MVEPKRRRDSSVAQVAAHYEQSPMPNLFIVGAMKAATTTRADQLGAHSEIFAPVQKEPNLFAELDECGRPYYRLVAPKLGSSEPGPISRTPSITAEEYRDLYRGSEAYRYRLDASTNYLPTPCSAKLIRRVAPDAKIIILLRNPYDRAYSSFAYQLSRGREAVSRFEAAVQAELSGERDEWAHAWRHIHTSCYDDAVARFQNEFAPEQVKVLLFNDFISEPRAVNDEIASFLSISKMAEVPRLASNETSIPKTRAAAAIKGVLSYGPLRRKMRRALPQRVQRTAKRVVDANLAWIDSRGERPSRPTEQALKRLAEVFEPEISKLESRLQRDLSRWRLASAPLDDRLAMRARPAVPAASSAEERSMRSRAKALRRRP